MKETIWGDWSFEYQSVHFFDLGDLCLWIQSREGELWIAHCYKNQLEEYPSEQEPPTGISWSRWALKQPVKRVKLTPVFADKPLVITSEYPLRLSTGTRIQIFTRVPIWVQLSIPRNNYLLTEIPTVQLSRTWFGNPLEGELCYHLRTKARRSLAQVENRPHVVNCPIIITNKADRDLNFEKFCYRVERLSIYRHDQAFWADETEIINRGGDLNSDVIMTGNMPEGIQRSELISSPRKKVNKSLATRTFKKIFEEMPL